MVLNEESRPPNPLKEGGPQPPKGGVKVQKSKLMR